MKLITFSLPPCLLLIWAASSLSGFVVHAQEAEPAARKVVLIAAASDLQFALPQLALAFEAEHPQAKIQSTFGSSGKFSEQVEQGAPFDLFLSADAQFPRKLIEAGHGREEDFFLYAIGHLVVWTQKTSALDVKSRGIRVLLDPSIKKIAIANPEHAPYGRAAVAALKKLDIYESIKDKLVQGDNVAQAAQFVQTGAADVGIIGLSLALGPKMQEEGKWAEVPLDSFPTLEQGGLVLARGKNTRGARDFKKWLVSPAGKTILQNFGFELPK